MFKKILVAAVILIVVLCAYMVLVADILTPRSERRGAFAVGINSEVKLLGLDEMNRAARERYGPMVQTPVRMIHGEVIWEAHVGDRVVETQTLNKKLSMAYGVLMVSGSVGTRTKFPFAVALEDNRLPSDLTDVMKYQLGQSAPAALLEFEARDWRMGDCFRPAASGTELKIIRAFAGLGQQNVCFAELQDRPARLLVGVAIMDRSWMALFGRRVCRSLSANWLDGLPQDQGGAMPNFVSCLLVASDPNQRSTNVLSAQFFEVRYDRSLALLHNSRW